MKKMLLKFSDGILSRSQMKEVKGGYGESGYDTCTLSCTVGPITKSCTSTSGNCSSSAYGEASPWIKCDLDPKLYC